MQKFVVDSHAWLSYFQKKAGFKALIEENALKTPVIVVAELSCVLKRRSEAPEKIKEALEFIRGAGVVVELDFEHAVKAGALSAKEKMHLSDAIVYSYASAEEPVLTGDKDFAGKPFVKFIG